MEVALAHVLACGEQACDMQAIGAALPAQAYLREPRR